MAIVGFSALITIGGYAFYNEVVLNDLDRRVVVAEAGDTPQELKQSLQKDRAASRNAHFVILGTDAYMSGTLDSDAPELVDRLLAHEPRVRRIIMINVPGTVDSSNSLVAARKIYDAKVATVVPRGGEIVSGGVDFFAAGTPHIVEEGAKVGVHSWAYYWFDILPDSGASKRNAKDPLHLEYINFYNTVDVDESFYWFTLRAAPPTELHYMTPEEIDKYFR